MHIVHNPYPLFPNESFRHRILHFNRANLSTINFITLPLILFWSSFSIKTTFYKN